MKTSISDSIRCVTEVKRECQQVEDGRGHRSYLGGRRAKEGTFNCYIECVFRLNIPITNDQTCGVHTSAVVLKPGPVTATSLEVGLLQLLLYVSWCDTLSRFSHFCWGFCLHCVA